MVLVVAVTALAAVMLGLMARGLGRRLSHLDAGLSTLTRQVNAGLAAHDHQVASLDRRMQDIEVLAAGAEREARIVSMQLVELHKSVVHEAELVRWLKGELTNVQTRLTAGGPTRGVDRG
jgi:uncharacterized coiled-coil protein SlyX